MGTASASGAKRTIEAAQRAIASPLLEAGAIDGARGILINITGSASLKLAEVQQACSIIQGAAHEDANIIFGAVLDEKMKDAVKITVIATGFREVKSARHLHQEKHSFASAHDNAMDFPQASDGHESTPDEMPEHIMSAPAMPVSIDERAYVDDAAPVAMHVSERGSADVITLDTMRNSIVTNFEPDDLDVPAFLRKRNDVM
jgi:cell division protein FtsZ